SPPRRTMRRGDRAMIHVHRILVPTDFSLPSQRALRYALELAKRFGAEIVLLHVVEATSYTTVIGVEGADVAAAELQDRARAWATGQLARMQRGEVPGSIRGRPLLRDGAAEREIVAGARDEDADLIVMATHGYTGLRHVLLGSTAERVVRQAPCPVLTVRDK